MASIRRKLAAGGLGLALVASVAGIPAAAAPKYPPSEPVAVACKLKAIKHRSKLKLNVNPNLPGELNYTFTLYKKKKIDGVRVWVEKATFTTKGSAEKRVMNRKKGKYRVLCLASEYGFLDTYSKVVKLNR